MEVKALIKILVLALTISGLIKLLGVWLYVSPNPIVAIGLVLIPPILLGLYLGMRHSDISQ